MTLNGSESEAIDSTTTAAQTSVMATCMGFIDAYGKGDLSKLEACRNIVEAITHGTTQGQEQVGDDALSRYLNILNARGQEAGDVVESGPNIPQKSQTLKDESSNPNADIPRLRPIRSNKRPRTPESEASDEEEEKRAKPNPTQYAWAGSDLINGVILDGDLKETIRLLKIYTVDLKR
ncbi:hypothetical protein AcW1_003071 [Taiwanofungus camphoratus]|nr:hypothetical protein AcW1_003071 [Antrodia cinnamomea]